MTEKGFRFDIGQTVWVRDKGKHGGFRIVEAKVEDHHYHPDRHPFYPNGEGYDLSGNLWWSCYPGCRVFGTRAEASAARLDRASVVALSEKIAREIETKQA